MHKIEKLRAQRNACVLNLLLPTKSGCALVYTERRTPETSNFSTFSEKLISLSKAILKYENFFNFNFDMN